MRQESGKSTLSRRAAFLTRFVLGGLGTASLAGGLFWVGAHPLVGWAEVPVAFAALGLGLIVVSLTLGSLPESIGLSIGSTLLALLVAMSVLTLAQIDPFRLFRDLRMRLFPPSVGIWRYDPRLGYANRPGISGDHETPYFDVTYTIDDRGCRITPDPEHPIGEILFLGCSFTFGLGVEDEETFPYLLGARYWTDYKVYNLSTPGWGTAHAYLNLIAWLEVHPTPAAVIYGWIPPHKTRNYIRADWVKHLGRPWDSQESEFLINDQRRHPHFEVEEGELVFQGTVGPEDVDEDPPDLLDREISVTQSFVREMAAECEKAAVPFVFLDLPVEDQPRDDIPTYLSEVLSASNILYVDARDSFRGILEGDGHPNADTYRAIAERVGSATVVHEAMRSEN